MMNAFESGIYMSSPRRGKVEMSIDEVDRKDECFVMVDN
jgi:hypothetical protein